MTGNGLYDVNKVCYCFRQEFEMVANIVNKESNLGHVHNGS